MPYEKIKTFYNSEEGNILIDKQLKIEPNNYYYNCSYGNNSIAFLTDEEYQLMQSDYSGLSDRVRANMFRVIAGDKILGLPLPEIP